LLLDSDFAWLDWNGNRKGRALWYSHTQLLDALIRRKTEAAWSGKSPWLLRTFFPNNNSAGGFLSNFQDSSKGVEGLYQPQISF
jgi:hypothetical protein